MIQDHEAREHLLAVLKERGIPLGANDISWAFASPKTREDVIAWVKEYLDEETLLTKDELELHGELSSAGRIAASPVANQSQYIIHDDELRSAIDALQESTNMIEQHSKVLETQREALEAIRNEMGQRHNPTSTASNPNPQYEQESSRLKVALEDLVTSLEEDLNTAEKQAGRALSSLSTVTSERLNADDQVLAALSKLSPRTMPPDSSQINEAVIDQLTRSLISFREREMKANIDAALNHYLLDAITGAGQVELPEDSPSKEDIEAEMVTLRDEIKSVIELVVGHEVREPLIQLLKSSKERTKQSQRDWLIYVLSTLEHMIGQLETISEHASALRGYSNAMQEIRTAYDSIEPKSSTDNSSPSKNASDRSSAGMNNKSKSRDDRSATSVMEQILRRFDIGKPVNDGQATLEALAKANSDSIVKLLSQYRSTEHTTLEALGQSLDERKLDMQRILAKLYSGSEYGSIRLSNRKLDGRIQELDKNIAAVADALSSADSGKDDELRKQVARLRTNWRR